MLSASEHGPNTTPVPDLNIYLDCIWQRHFSDIPRVNEVEIAYGHPWKQRLGLIRLSLDNKLSFIGINALHQHANNVVDRELEQRGLGECVRSCDEWIDREWFAFYQVYRKLPCFRRRA